MPYIYTNYVQKAWRVCHHMKIPNPFTRLVEYLIPSFSQSISIMFQIQPKLLCSKNSRKIEDNRISQLLQKKKIPGKVKATEYSRLVFCWIFFFFFFVIFQSPLDLRSVYYSRPIFYTAVNFYNFGV